MKKYGVLTEEHLSYLIDQNTLKEMIGMNLDERVGTFNKRYEGVKITREDLFRIYRKLDIRRKVIMFDTLKSPKHQFRINKFLETVKQKVRDAPGGRENIVYIDEVTFTRRTYPTHAYSSPGMNMIIDKKKIN